MLSKSVLHVTILLLAICLSPVSADRSTTTPTSWFWRTGSPDVIRDQVDDGYCIVDLQVVSTSPYTLTALFVRNSGEYGKTWYWYWNINAATLADKIDTLDARIVDLEPYTIGGTRLFAVILHKNTGTNAKNWWYYYDASPSFIAQKLSDNKARLIDLDSYSVSGSTKYSAVMIRNTGSDARTWWWYYNVSPSFIAGKLRDNKARLTDIERNGPGKYSVIMEKTSLRWYYYYGQTSSSLLQKASQNGARIVDIEPYNDGGTRKYVGIMVSNVNDLTGRVFNYISPRRTGGAFGFFMKQIGGPTRASLQSSYVYEPASSIKALHLAHSMKQVQIGTDELSNQVDIFADIIGSCPQNTGLVTETLELALTKMMRQSSNSRTQAIRTRYGENSINLSAQQLGMTSSRIRHRIGCGGSSPGIIGQTSMPNSLTLVDITRLYERVATSFLSGTHRTKFFSIMSGYSSLNSIVAQEAGKLPLATETIKEQFRTLIFARQKGGSYTINSRYYRSIGAYVKLPFRSCNGAIHFKEYTLGAFVDQSTSSISSGVIGNTGAETMRDEIRKGLISFQPCFKVATNPSLLKA